MYKRYTFDYLVKIDDDTLLDAHTLPALLASKPPDRLYWGFFRPSVVTHEPTMAKYDEPKFFFCKTHFPVRKIILII